MFVYRRAPDDIARANLDFCLAMRAFTTQGEPALPAIAVELPEVREVPAG
jgi:hypothetical protein